jgi:hypothetical protein
VKRAKDGIFECAGGIGIGESESISDKGFCQPGRITVQPSGQHSDQTTHEVRRIERGRRVSAATVVGKHLAFSVLINQRRDDG